MQKKCKQSMSILISLLMCLNQFVVPVMAEEENVPEITEEPVTEITEKAAEEEPSEVIETPEETQKEETPEVLSKVEETAEPEVVEITKEAQENPEQSLPNQFIEDSPEWIEMESKKENNTNELNEINESSTDELSDEGIAYAVLTDEGELIFFRSFNTYNAEQVTDVVDVYSNHYKGKLYTDVETTDELGFFVAEADKEKIKTIFVAKNQVVKPNRLRFDFCKNLTTFDSSGIITNSITDMSSMFAGCSSLKSNLGDEKNIIVLIIELYFVNCVYFLFVYYLGNVLGILYDGKATLWTRDELRCEYASSKIKLGNLISISRDNMIIRPLKGR